MRRIFYGVILCFSLTFAGGATAQTLWVLSAADVDDPFIGVGAAANAQLLQNSATVISLITKMDLKFVEVKGDGFKCSDIVAKAKGLNITSNDVVIFYYSGHGFAPLKDPNDKTKTAQSMFPWFYCKVESGTGRPNQEDITRLIAEKKPRLIISVADTCNVVLPIAEPPFSAKGLVEANVREMYMKFRGTLMISSSTRGQKSWYRPGGGFFSSRFLPLLIDPPEAASASWESVVRQSTEVIKVEVSDGYFEDQKPQALLDVTYGQ